MSSLRGIRQHLQVTMPAGTFEVWTKPFDYDLFGTTAKKHGWADYQENPVGYLLFLAWSASRRGGQIEATLTYEKFKEAVEDIAELDEDPVDPTSPAPGAG